MSLDSKNKQILHIYFVTKKKKKVLCFYFIYIIFLGNVLIGVRTVFLPNCPLILFLLKHRSAGAFLNKKNEDLKQEKPLKW